MSLITCVAVQTGIVISADTRVTLPISLCVETAPGSGIYAPAPSTIMQSDNAQKVFTLYNKYIIGCFGTAEMNNVPVANYVQQMAIAAPPATTQLFATMVLNSFRALAPIPATYFFVAGYDAMVPSVYQVDITANTSNRVNITGTGALQYTCWTGGMNQVVNRLNAGAAAPDFSRMYFRDAVDYSRFLVSTTIDQLRFENLRQTQTVGGNVNSVTATPLGTSFID